MSRAVVVEVTAEDIAVAKREGCQELACLCPISRALKRVVVDAPKDFGVYQAGEGEEAYYFIGTGNMDVRAKLPEDANTFVRDFDDYRPVAPFTFTVELS